MSNYDIFMAMVEKIGHDKRGNPIFKRDKYGNEILIPEENNITAIGQIADGTRTVKTVSKTKILDDQTPLVVDVFKKWKQEEGILW